MGLVRHRAQDDQETDASQAAGDQDRVAQDNARPHRENRCLGETDAERASDLLLCLGYPPEPVVVLQQGEAALARIAQAAQPNGAPQLGEVHPVRRPLLSANQNYYTRCLVTASTPEPEGGARCVSSARRDLRGGRGEILVPTATIKWEIPVNRIWPLASLSNEQCDGRNLADVLKRHSIRHTGG